MGRKKKIELSEYEEGRKQLQKNIDAVKENVQDINQLVPQGEDFQKNGWAAVATIGQIALNTQSQVNILNEKVNYLMDEHKNDHDRITPAQYEVLNELVQSQTEHILIKNKLKGGDSERWRRKATIFMIWRIVKKAARVNKRGLIKASDFEHLTTTVIPFAYREISKTEINERASRYAVSYEIKLRKIAEETAKQITVETTSSLRLVK